MWEVLKSLDASAWFEILGVLGTLLIGFIFLRMRGVFVTQKSFSAWVEKHVKEHDKILERLGDGEDEFTTIRSQLDKLATAEQLQKMRLDVAEVRGEIGKLEERIDGQIDGAKRTEKTLDRIEEFLLNASGGR